MSNIVNVTAQDIKNGRVGDPCSCPIARAINRKRGYSRARVGYSLLIAHTPEGLRKFYLPFHVTQKVLDFDQGESVQPFTFELPTAYMLSEDPHLDV